MKTRSEEKIKKVYDFIKPLVTKEQKKTIDIVQGVKYKVEYSIDTEGDWEYFMEADLNTEYVSFSGEFKKVMDIIFGGPPQDSYSIDYNKYLGIPELNRQFAKLYREAGLDADDLGWFEGDTLSGYNWKRWWNAFSDEETVRSNPTIKLNSVYDAIIDKKSKTIKVGCQTISIDKVREIISEYDKG